VVRDDIIHERVEAITAVREQKKSIGWRYPRRGTKSGEPPFVLVREIKIFDRFRREEACPLDQLCGLCYLRFWYAYFNVLRMIRG
jgi:hypothetical protein